MQVLVQPKSPWYCWYQYVQPYFNQFNNPTASSKLWEEETNLTSVNHGVSTTIAVATHHRASQHTAVLS